MFDLEGLKGEPVASTSKASEILTPPIFLLGKGPPDHQMNLEWRGILDIRALSALLATLSVNFTQNYIFPFASSLLNLQHYTGKYFADLPCYQPKTVVVDGIPFGSHCDLLEEV